MMNDSEKNLYFYQIRQKILQSTQIEEVVQLIEEISSLLSSADTSLEAYDLLPLAFQSLREFTQEDVNEGERLIFEYVLPSLISIRGNETHINILSALSRMRECLVDWFEQYPEPQRYALRDYVLDQLLLQLGKEPTPSLCWILSDIGFRRQDIARTLKGIAEHHDDELGDHALATLTALGIPTEERESLLVTLQEQAAIRITLPLIAALGRLADPSSLSLVQTALRQDEAEQSLPYRSLVLRLLPDIAEEDDREEIQNQVWQTIVELFQQYPEKFAFDMYLGSDIAPRCNSVNVVPTLVQWIGNETGFTEVTADHRRLLGLRLENCVRPRHLQGWGDLSIPSAVSVLQNDACQDTHFEGRATTHEMHIKETAWQTLLLMGYGDALHWFEEAVLQETNHYFRREMCDVFACFCLDKLPPGLIHQITEPFDVRLPDASAELVARLGAIEVARSAASLEAFEALLTCGLSYQGQNLRDAVDALEDVALTLARSGDNSVVRSLVDTIVQDQESRFRTAAGSTLEALAAEGLLPGEYIPALKTTLLKQEERDPYERSLIVAALGYLEESEFPKDLLPHLQSWALDRNDWLGIQSFMALARQDELMPHTELLTKIGLVRDGELWNVSNDATFTDWTAHVIGLLYTRHQSALLPAVASLIETLNWGSSLPILLKTHDAHRGTKKSSLPAIIAEAFVRRIQQRQTRIYAELDIFQIASELLPERLAQEPWDNVWEDWLSESKAALADALGGASYEDDSAKTKAIALLQSLTGDGQYAVRRAAYRGLAHKSPQSLQTLCRMWFNASTLELRQRAAEAWAWLPEDVEDAQIDARIYESLAADKERSVRASISRTLQEKRKREWAEEYLMRIRQVTGKTNEGVLAAWCYAQALTHVGDDLSIQILRTDLRTRPLSPSHRHWLKRIVKETKDGWEKATKKWPQPWRLWQGSIEEGQGALVPSDGQNVPMQYALWQERTTTLSESSSWGGTIQIEDTRISLSADEITLRLADGRLGKALVETSFLSGSFSIVGQGPYPE